MSRSNRHWWEHDPGVGQGILLGVGLSMLIWGPLLGFLFGLPLWVTAAVTIVPPTLTTLFVRSRT